MAYSSATSDNKTINYLNKDFSDFKDALINMAQIYYPDTVNDFSEASPGTMFIERYKKHFYNMLKKEKIYIL